MSQLVGPDGKTPIQSDPELKEFKAGGLRFETGLTPSNLLNKALDGARQMIGQQTYAMALEKTKSHVIAQTEAQTAVASVSDPFLLEPCALAVFMYLSREIEYRDSVIAQLDERLQRLGAPSLDLTHPYPEPEFDEEEEAEAEGSEDPPETLPDEPEESEDSDS